MAGTPSGDGYWMVASDGGVFAFGDAGYHGSLGGQPLAAPVKGIEAAPDGAGYWIVGGDGRVAAFGSARYLGAPGAAGLAAPVVGMAGG
jgi:hypothetical protein